MEAAGAFRVRCVLNAPGPPRLITSVRLNPSKRRLERLFTRKVIGKMGRKDGRHP
jgi:hypothetical protein